VHLLIREAHLDRYSPYPTRDGPMKAAGRLAAARFSRDWGAKNAHRVGAHLDARMARQPE
jgi:hypothetical protein